MDNMNVSDIISKIMADPALMNSLKSTAQSLFGSEGMENAESQVSKNEPSQTSQTAENTEKSDLPREIHDENESNEKSHIDNENRMQLLIALKPYMDSDRREKIDYMLKIMKLLQITEIGGLLKNLL